MKRGKKLTREQKAIVLGHGLDTREWTLAYVVNDSYIKIQHKETGIQKTIDVYKKSKSRWGY